MESIYGHLLVTFILFMLLPFILGAWLHLRGAKNWDGHEEIKDPMDGSKLFNEVSTHLYNRYCSGDIRKLKSDQHERISESLKDKKKFLAFVAHCHALGLTVNFEPLDYQPEQPDGLDTQIVLR